LKARSSGLKLGANGVFDARDEKADEKSRILRWIPEKTIPQGAKAQVNLVALAARLKPCPFKATSFSAACRAHTLRFPGGFFGDSAPGLWLQGLLKYLQRQGLELECAFAHFC
jgi:hypothetical protein